MPTARALAAMRVIDSSTSRERDHHQVGELVDHDEDERQPLELPLHPGCALQVAAVEGGVVAGDVTHADLGEQVVADLHLLDRPVEGVRGLLRVGHHLGEQVRDAVVLGELDLLGVDEDHPDLLGRGPHEDRRDDRVDARRLAGAGLTGDEHVRHLGEVHEDGLALDVSTDAHLERMGRPVRFLRGEDVAQVDHLAVLVRHLDTDGLTARDGSEDADIRRRHGVGDVLVQAGQTSDLDPDTELEFVAGDRRPHDHSDEAGLDAVFGEGPLEHPPTCLDGLGVDSSLPGQSEQLLRREAPRGALGARAEADLELFGLCGATVVDLGICDDDGDVAGCGDGFVLLALRLRLRLDGCVGVLVEQRGGGLVGAVAQIDVGPEVEEIRQPVAQRVHCGRHGIGDRGRHLAQRPAADEAGGDEAEQHQHRHGAPAADQQCETAGHGSEQPAARAVGTETELVEGAVLGEEQVEQAGDHDHAQAHAEPAQHRSPVGVVGDLVDGIRRSLGAADEQHPESDQCRRHQHLEAADE